MGKSKKYLLQLTKKNAVCYRHPFGKNEHLFEPLNKLEIIFFDVSQCT